LLEIPFLFAPVTRGGGAPLVIFPFRRFRSRSLFVSGRCVGVPHSRRASPFFFAPPLPPLFCIRRGGPFLSTTGSLRRLSSTLFSPFFFPLLALFAFCTIPFFALPGEGCLFFFPAFRASFSSRWFFLLTFSLSVFPFLRVLSLYRRCRVGYRIPQVLGLRFFSPLDTPPPFFPAVFLGLTSAVSYDGEWFGSFFSPPPFRCSSRF